MIKNEFYKNFKKELIKQGYKKGDTILLTCDLLKFLIYFRKKNQIFDLDKFLDIFIDIIGKNGTLILNAFNWDFCKGIDFNLKNTPAMTGALSNFALKRKEFLRSQNPIYSFVSTGFHSKKISKMKHKSCFSFQSPFGFMIDINAKNLFINLDYKNSGFTFLHVAEEYQQIKYRTFKKFSGYIITGKIKKKITTQMFVRDLKKKTKAKILKSMDKELIRNNAMRKFKFDNFDLSTLFLKKTFNIFKRELINKNHIEIINPKV